MPDIAIFVPSLQGGGAERVMVSLANAFAARGFNVDMVLAAAIGPFLNEVSSRVRVVNLKSGRAIKALLPLAWYLRRERPKALLSAMGHANVVALLARKLARCQIRIVVSERGLISGEYALARGSASRLTFRLIPILYPKADAICSVSKGASNDLAVFLSLPLERVQTIYNPFDLSNIKARAAEPLNHPWFDPGQPPVVLSVGRLNEAKNFDVLISAFSLLRRQRMARLVILGEGELRLDLEAQLVRLGLTDEAVQLPGFMPNPYPWLARCSLFVLSSLREGLPGVLIEAMACGASIVSTDCLSGPDEILEGGQWGRLVAVGDAEALAQAMADTLDLPSIERPNVQRRAADFEQEHAVNAYLRILGLPLQADPSAVSASPLIRS